MGIRRRKTRKLCCCHTFFGIVKNSIIIRPLPFLHFSLMTQCMESFWQAKLIHFWLLSTWISGFFPLPFQCIYHNVLEKFWFWKIGKRRHKKIYTVGVNVNWHSLCRKWYGDFFKIKNCDSSASCCAIPGEAYSHWHHWD